MLLDDEPVLTLRAYKAGGGAEAYAIAGRFGADETIGADRQRSARPWRRWLPHRAEVDWHP
jgi:hypothetical protein